MLILIYITHCNFAGKLGFTLAGKLGFTPSGFKFIDVLNGISLTKKWLIIKDTYFCFTHIKYIRVVHLTSKSS